MNGDEQEKLLRMIGDMTASLNPNSPVLYQDSIMMLIEIRDFVRQAR